MILVRLFRSILKTGTSSLRVSSNCDHNFDSKCIFVNCISVPLTSRSKVCFKTSYEKVKTHFHFEGSKVFFLLDRTKCYFAQCLPLNLTVSIAIVVVPRMKLIIIYTY